ncbi:anti-sigma factor [Lelliottia aquatilis]|uniref:anti-sigma factor n=1 Tax=Lelliottia aquatilis TaxID=2080838 RepID=UPI00192AC369|nr:anti-sigma factor [Lelliottia aquatilis]MBL5884363.1 anti-sigma factor [Lelliottia aquatilis]
MNDHNEKRDDALAAEYALGTLRGNARLRFQKRLMHERDLAERVARWETMFSTLDSHLKPVQPPESVWKKIAINLPAQPTVRRNRPYLGWMAAAGLAAVALVTWYTTREPELTPLVVLNDTQQHGQWVVSADSQRQQLSLTPLRPAALTPNSSLQLWLIPAGGTPVSLGLLNSQAPTQVKLSHMTLAADAVIAISLEPQGGSPTGQPTGPVLFSDKI